MKHVNTLRSKMQSILMVGRMAHIITIVHQSIGVTVHRLAITEAR
jgi:hypothetical protein